MRDIPPHVAEVIEALKFRCAQPEVLRSLSDAQWESLLPLCDMMHLTIPLRRNCGDDLPQLVQSRIDQNICDNAERYERIKVVYLELANALGRQGIDHLVLKGFSQSPAFVDDPRFRMQSDIDLFCLPESILDAREALSSIGYTAEQGVEHQPIDHLPTMRRDTSWSWRGNHFDPEMPISVELHFRFWNQKTTRLGLKGLDEFWTRQIRRSIDNLSFPTLSTVDSLGYSALHVFRHLMGGLIPHHVFELAYFLHTHADNGDFWAGWRNLHDDSLRRLEAVCFCLAVKWFNCSVSPEVQNEIDCLPTSVREWFRKYSDSPLNSLVRPNKDALWLHLNMLESSRDRLFVFSSGLFPVRVPPLKAVSQWSLRAYARFFKHSVTRVAFHLRSLPRTLWEGLR